MRFWSKFKMTKTSKYCKVHQENTCKSYLNSNSIVLTDFCRLTKNLDQLQN